MGHKIPYLQPSLRTGAMLVLISTALSTGRCLLRLLFEEPLFTGWTPVVFAVVDVLLVGMGCYLVAKSPALREHSQAEVIRQRLHRAPIYLALTTACGFMSIIVDSPATQNRIIFWICGMVLSAAFIIVLCFALQALVSDVYSRLTRVVTWVTMGAASAHVAIRILELSYHPTWVSDLRSTWTLVEHNYYARTWRWYVWEYWTWTTEAITFLPSLGIIVLLTLILRGRTSKSGLPTAAEGELTAREGTAGGKPKRIPLTAFTEVGRQKQAAHLVTKFESQGWKFVRQEDGDGGNAFLHFVAPVIPLSSYRRVALRGGAGLAIWLGLCFVLPTPMTYVSSAVAIGAIVLALSGQLRARAFSTARKGVAGTVLVGVAGSALLGVFVARERRHEQVYNRALAVVSKGLADGKRLHNEPVMVYQEAAAALRVFTRELDSRADYMTLERTARMVMRRTEKPFAANRYREARRLAHNRQYVQAEAAAQEAVRIDPDLPSAKRFLEYLSIKVAKLKNGEPGRFRGPSPGSSDGVKGRDSTETYPNND